MIHSTMLGLAIGDALGQPFEFSSASQIIQSGWQGDMVYGDVWRLNPGQYTDDCKMALCIANSLIDKNGYDSNDLANKYVKWVESGDLRGIGITCEASIKRLASGVDPTQSGKKFSIQQNLLKKLYDGDGDLYGIGDFCGNGTVMRCAPIGEYYSGNHKLREKAAQNDATMTHDHADARDASKLLCNIISACIEFPEAPILEAIKYGVNITNFESSHVRRLVDKAINLSQDKTTNFASAIALGESGTAHATLATAIFSCLKYASFKDILTAAVLIGGDTDSRAAVAGAIAGTYYGLDNIPQEWVETVEDSYKLQELDKKLLNHD